MIPGEREYFSNISFHFLRIHVDKIDPVYRLDWIDGLHATITFFDNVKRCRVSGFCSSPSTLHAFSLFYRRFTARSVATNFSSSHFQIGETPTALASLPSVDNTIGHINTNFPRNAKDSWNSSYLDETESPRWCNPGLERRQGVAIFRGKGKSKGRKRVNNRETSERISFECAFKSSHRIAERGPED